MEVEGAPSSPDSPQSASPERENMLCGKVGESQVEEGDVWWHGEWACAHGRTPVLGGGKDIALQG
jgi:hypothetical protein